MVLALLAVIWAAVLLPPLLRRGVETRRRDSVGDFRRHLGVLQRTGPGLIAPAHTRRAASLATNPSQAGLPAGSTRRATAPNRARTLRRRRNVLTGLIGTSVLLLAVGMVPSAHLVLAGAAAAFALLLAYVVMLVRMRNAAAEREMKLTFLPSPGPARRGLASAEGGMLLRRSAN